MIQIECKYTLNSKTVCDIKVLNSSLHNKVQYDIQYAVVLHEDTIDLRCNVM